MKAGIGLFLTCLMILIFLGSMRATVAVFFSIPLSALTTLHDSEVGGSSINSMVLGGLALAFSRLIDNSVVVLENIHRHLELGDPPPVAAEKGGQEVALPVLAATLTTIVVFFPVTLLFGVSKFLFSALALAVVISLAASYMVAMTVVPLFCARFLQASDHADSGDDSARSAARASAQRFNAGFQQRLRPHAGGLPTARGRVLRVPRTSLIVFGVAFAASLAIFPLLGSLVLPAHRCRPVRDELKAPSGTKLSETEKEIARVEAHRSSGRDAGRSADDGFEHRRRPRASPPSTRTNSAMHTAFVQVNLKAGHRTGSYEYIDRMKAPARPRDAGTGDVLLIRQPGGCRAQHGVPAPIDVQVAGTDQKAGYQTALDMAAQIRAIPDVADVFIPQDIDYPALQLDIDRVRAGELGLYKKKWSTMSLPR